MMPLALVFPGQGSQSVGMLSALGERYASVGQCLMEGSEALGLDLAQLIGEGPPERLNATEYTQPAMLTAGVALWRLWQTRGGADPGEVSGHSLGEFTALVCAGALPLGAAADLVRFRGQAMQEAVPAGTGAMAAILGLSDALVASSCAQAAQGEVVEAVNFNGPGQVVIAGTRGAVERAIEACRAAGAKRAIVLPLSVPSHCSLMQPAALRARSRQDHGWRLAVECTNWTYAIDTDYLVDASGRWSVLGGRKQRAGDRTLAIYGYWRGRFLPCEPKIESAPEAWYWGVPLPDGTYNVMAFVGLAAYRSQRFASLSAAYDKFIGRTSLMAGMLDARLVGPVRATDASAYLDPDNIGPGWIKIGEAALALDPLSSTGVQNAITTALSGSIVVNTLLRRAEQAETAMQFYRTRLRQFSQRHQRWAAELYATALPRHRRPFWEARAASPVAAAEPIPARFDLDRPPPNALRVGLASGVILEEEPCIIGDFIAPRLALRHPNLERPVAFVGGSEVAHLLRPLYPGITLGALMDAWPISATPKTAIAGWLLSHGVLEPYTSTTRVVACS